MGAPQNRLLESAIGLKNRGHEVMIITAMPNYPKGKIFDGYRGKIFVKETIKELEVNRYYLYPSNSKKSIPRIISMLSFSITALLSWRKVRRFKPDYIITESPPLTLAYTGLWLSRISGSKHIMNVSDIWPLSALEIGAISKGRLYNLLEKFEKYLYQKSYACFGQSRQIIDHIKKNGGNNTILFRNGVDFNRFNNYKQQPRNTSQPLRIVYAGLLGVAQGILELCKNIDFKTLNVEFHVYGEGAERNELVNFLDGKNDTNIYLHNSVPSSEVPDTIMQYDITLIPLKKAIFGAVPSKIYESMAAGLPIIFTGGGEGAEIIIENKIGWVCSPADYNSISDTISNIQKSTNIEIDILKENCRKTAKELFNRDIQIDKINIFLSQHHL